MASASSTPEPNEPRRSGRARKQTQGFSQNQSQGSNSSGGKRKRTQVEDDGDMDVDGSDEERDQEGEEDEPEESEEEEEEETPKKKKAKRTTTRKSPVKKSTATAKKPKTTTDRPPAKRTKNAAATVGGGGAKRRGRKAKGDAEFDLDKLSKETKIHNDNPLFNAILNPNSALQNTVEDFLLSLDSDSPLALADLVNCMLRCCGCNTTVTSDEAVDLDGAIDTLDHITEELKSEETTSYPLTSKFLNAKKFRSQLSEFLSRLVLSSADTGALYEKQLMQTVQAWVASMCTSQIRSFRHTATVIAMESEAGLCEVAAKVEKEMESVSRMRDADKKKQKGGTAKGKELEKKVKEVRARQKLMDKFLLGFIDGVFIHRYRDTDPLIRAECISSLGIFFRKHPSHFLTSSYLRYVGWLLSDNATPVRLAAVKCLQIVYDTSSSELLSTFNTFTERFKTRLLEMAESDIDVSVRVGVLGILSNIDKLGLMEEEDREKLGALVFHEEAKVRKGVGKFVKGIWEENVQEKMDEIDVSASSSALQKRKTGDQVRMKVGFKVLAELLVSWGKRLDDLLEEGPEDEDEEMDMGLGAGSSQSTQKRAAAVASTTSPSGWNRGRIGLAMETLADDLSSLLLDGWNELLEFLLKDHSDEDENILSSPRKKGKRKDQDESNKVDEAYRLDDSEEDVLLEVLCTILAIVKERSTAEVAKTNKRGEEGEEEEGVTRALIDALPRLFVKYQTDEGRMKHVLTLPRLMNLDTYVEMREIASYTTLWDNLIKQYTTHSSPEILTLTAHAFTHMLRYPSLANTNSTKVVELEEELSSQLHSSPVELDATAMLEEDEITRLTGVSLRVKTLSGVRNMTGWMEDDEGGKQSKAWDLFTGIAERGRRGHEQEEMMVEHSLHVLTLHAFWKKQELSRSPELLEDQTYMDNFLSQRESLVDQLTDYAIGQGGNAGIGVKQVAFQNLLHLYIMFRSPDLGTDAEEEDSTNVFMKMDDETQSRCAGYLQAEIDRYAEIFSSSASPSSSTSRKGNTTLSSDIDHDEASDHSENEDEEANKDSTSLPVLLTEHAVNALVCSFLQALRCGIISLRSSDVAGLVSHHGRLGTSFDAFVKFLADMVRDESLLGDHPPEGQAQGEMLCALAVQAIQDAYGSYMAAHVSTTRHTLDLAKLLQGHFIIRGTQLSVVRRISTAQVVQVQARLIDWIVGVLKKSSSKLGKGRGKEKVLRGFFKVLSALVSTQLLGDKGEGLRIKAHVDQALAQAQLKGDGNEEIDVEDWDEYKAYTKRLSGSKEKGTKGKRGRRKAGDGGTTTEGEETGMSEREDGPEKTPKNTRSRSKAQAKAKAKPKPKPKPKKAKQVEEEPGSEPEQDEDEQEQEDGERETTPTPTVRTPRANRPKPQAVYGKKASTSPNKKRVRAEEDEDIDGDGEDDEDLHASPRKRQRSEPAVAPEETTGEGGSGALQVRKKRARH